MALSLPMRLPGSKPQSDGRIISCGLGRLLPIEFRLRSGNRAISVFKFSQKILGIIISLMLIGMVVVICMQTFCRTVIFRSIPWSEELSRYFFVWITVLGSSLAISQKLLVKIDVIDQKLKEITVWKLEHFRLLLGLIMQVVYCYSACLMIPVGAFQKSAALKLPMQYMYLIIAIGFFFSIMAVLAEFVYLRRGKDAVMKQAAEKEAGK